MRFVLDASVTLCWCFDDENEPLADKAAHLLASTARAAVPALWWFEIRNAMTMGLRRNRLPKAKFETFLSDVALLNVDIEDIPDDRRIFELAERHRITFYDAAYLELAHRERLPLATLDQALVKAAADEGIALITA